MKRMMIALPCATLLCLAASLQAADKEMAAALAASGTKLASDGKPDKAKELFYKALANDDNCPEALFELGKIFEREGATTAAADFLVKASRELAKAEAGSPAFASKRKDADMRVLRLNPYATRLNGALADYTGELNAITKKSSDSLTLEEACDRADALHLRTVLPPEKAPKFERPAPAVTKRSEPEHRGSSMVSRMRRPVETNVPADVKAALERAGWTTITGVWKKKAENVYEVSDGKLETPKINGAIQVVVHRGGAGKVRAFVRNNQEDYDGVYSYGSGFGYLIEGQAAKLYAPSGGYNNRYYSYMEREDPLPGGMPKDMITITVEEGRLEYFINGVSKKKANYPISKSGPFSIIVDGTVTIEAPMAKGQ